MPFHVTTTNADERISLAVEDLEIVVHNIDKFLEEHPGAKAIQAIRGEVVDALYRLQQES